jgi:hypothetical protein
VSWETDYERDSCDGEHAMSNRDAPTDRQAVDDAFALEALVEQDHFDGAGRRGA